MLSVVLLDVEYFERGFVKYKSFMRLNFVVVCSCDVEFYLFF